jgi:hypothetical protein
MIILGNEITFNLQGILPRTASGCCARLGSKGSHDSWDRHCRLARQHESLIGNLGKRFS